MNDETREALDVPGLPALSTEGTAESVPLVMTETALGSEHFTLEPASAPADAPVKRRRKRRTKAQLQAEEAARQAAAAPAYAPGQSPEAVSALGKALGLGFDTAGRILGQMRGAHWQLSQAETDTLGNAWAVALAPYLGQAGPYMPVLAAVLVTVGVAAPRVIQDRSNAPPVLPAPAPATAPAEVVAPEPVAAGAPVLSPDTVIPIEPPRRARTRAPGGNA